MFLPPLPPFSFFDSADLVQVYAVTDEPVAERASRRADRPVLPEDLGRGGLDAAEYERGRCGLVAHQYGFFLFYHLNLG